jgi:hypothetical protein
MGAVLWPFIDNSFLFSVVFWGVFHDRWDELSIQWFKDNFEFVEFDEWLGLPKPMNKKAHADSKNGFKN